MSTTKSARDNSPSQASEAFGAFLRAMRSRTQPGSVGISSVGQRRVPGLRREEVAQLAGVGVAWYTWLEQGRDVNVSSDVLERLHVALALSPSEREHLFALAHNRPPPNVGFDGGAISRSSAALLGRMADAAYVANTRWDVLAWNGAAVDLFCDLSSAQGRHSADHLAAVSTFIAEHKLLPVIDATFAFDEAPRALERLRSGAHFGKVVIEWR